MDDILKSLQNLRLKTVHKSPIIIRLKNEYKKTFGFEISASQIDEAIQVLQGHFVSKEAEYKKAFANPYNAAQYGYIDDVIEPRNTRFRIIRALQQLQTKKLSNPAKKHDNLPL